MVYVKSVGGNMKKIFSLLIIILLLTGCKNNANVSTHLHLNPFGFV